MFTACGRFLSSERIAEGVKIGVLDGLGFAGFSRDEVLERLREFAFSFHREFAAKQGKPRWASKTAFDAFYLDEIEALCGERVSFVCIQRHGLDVACSIQELCDKNGGYLRELQEYVSRYPIVLEAFAHAWVDLTQKIDAFVKRHPQSSVLVTYEDLAKETDRTMARIIGFLGEEWSAALIDKALGKREGLGLGDWKTYGRSSVDSSSVGRWKSLSRDTIARLGAICNPTLTLCGYEPVQIQAERDPDEIRRRHQVGLLLQRLSSSSDPSPGDQKAPSRKKGTPKAGR